MVFLLIFYLILGSLSIVYLYLVKTNQHWENRNVPFVKPDLFYGNAKGVGKKFHGSEMFRRLYLELKNCGPISGVFLYTRTSAMVTDLDLLKTIMVKDFNTFINRGTYSNEKDDPLSADIVNLEDDHWRSMRQKLTPTFTSAKIKMMFETITSIADKLVVTIKKETALTGQLEVKDVLGRFTTDVIGSAAFGIECSSLRDKNTNFHEMGLKTFSSFSFFNRALMQKYRNIARSLHMITTDNEISNFYIEVVAETLKYRKENPQVKRNDFINMLKDFKASGELTFNQIAAQSAFFFLAGYITSSTTLTYCMYELAVNEEIQKKLRESMKTVLQKFENKLSYESIQEMQFLEQCINEALRKYPPFPTVSRVASVDYPIPNTKIVLEKGTSVIVPIHAIHHDPEIYPNPEKYDPDRFAPQEVRKRHPFSWLPFGKGPRVCLAMRFALVEVKIALAKIVTNFEFTLDRSQTSVPLKISPSKMILSPAEGVVIKFKSI